ncbi:zinc finger MYM-type protein 1-like [Hibiscus syriacus]|uniref:zinc finger MYM-type protein 1-like n=1 Tax=Hibiscus syriacus TaxID=106335 RepID=UPI0019205CB1|nr:zinc finger MYM-type protein 1-like [Hibiscus syriacus]
MILVCLALSGNRDSRRAPLRTLPTATTASLPDEKVGRTLSFCLFWFGEKLKNGRGSIGNYFKRKLDVGDDGSSEGSSKRNSSNEVPQRPQPTTVSPTPMASIPTTINVNDLRSDPADRPKITSYHPNQKDEIRRAYWIKGPCQPRGQQGGRDAFVTEGFSTWSKKKSLYAHVGNVDSLHNKARQKCENLEKKNQSISDALHKQTEHKKSNYEIRLRATIVTCRFLLENKLSFRGHDESNDSISKGLFIETLSLIREHNESIYNVTLEKAPKNDKLTSPKIQKDIVECFSKEIIKSICDEIGKDVFAILVDESSDVSKKEQMAMVLRYVDRLGVVKERFIGVVHVTDTSSLTLKAAIDSVFTDNKLSMAHVRGQGYDGASNMCGEFNGLKALILRDNKSAYYVHCFAHQPQLVIVAVAKNHDGAHEFFEQVALVVNVVCASCKRKDIIRESYKKRLQTEIGIGETGRGLNQELSLIRAGDTRWGSHYKTIISLMNLFPEVIEVLKYVEEDGILSN